MFLFFYIEKNSFTDYHKRHESIVIFVSFEEDQTARFIRAGNLRITPIRLRSLYFLFLPSVKFKNRSK